MMKIIKFIKKNQTSQMDSKIIYTGDKNSINYQKIKNFIKTVVAWI